jgi:hypothetical protein
MRGVRVVAVAVAVAIVLGGCADDDDTATERTDPPVTTSSAPTTTSVVPASTSATADPTPCPVAAATIATDLGRSPGDVNGGHDCSGDWGWIDLECAEPDPEVGCLHSGNVVRRVEGRWVRVDALLQDCAESFTIHGAPNEDAEDLYPRCHD